MGAAADTRRRLLTTSAVIAPSTERTAETASGHALLHRPDLGCSVPHVGHLRGPVDGRVQVGHVDEEEPKQVLLFLDERPIGQEPLSAPSRTVVAVSTTSSSCAPMSSA